LDGHAVKRADEIRELNPLSVEELVVRAGGRLVVLDDLDALHAHFAASIADTIRRNNAADRDTVLILPYGPTGQYPILRDTINRERISLSRTTIFFMDEYADAAGRALPASHPLSFRGAIAWLWDALEPALRPSEARVLFPDETNIDRLGGMIREAGGVEVCYGGIGIHGHIAFNEPEPGVRDSGCRCVRLNDFTVTINSIRSHVGGDLENFPRHALTLGMRQCLGARRVRLYCRNDVPGLDWANTILRLAVLGQPGDDYPVTWIREHGDWQVIADRNTASPPAHVL
jgi:glucosamine-6-phosphate deaminase